MGRSDVARGRSAPIGPGGGLGGGWRAGAETVERLPLSTTAASLAIGVSGSSSNGWETLAAEYG